MPEADSHNWLVYLLIALVAFVAGRVTAGSGAGDGLDRVTRRQRAEGDAREVWRNLSPQAKSRVDELLGDRKMIEAVKVVRNESGVGLKAAKAVVDLRRKEMVVQ